MPLNDQMALVSREHAAGVVAWQRPRAGGEEVELLAYHCVALCRAAEGLGQRLLVLPSLSAGAAAHGRPNRVARRRQRRAPSNVQRGAWSCGPPAVKGL